MLDHGDAEGKGLAGTGGGFGDDILPFQQRRDGFFLNSRGISVALLFERFEDLFRQVQVLKCLLFHRYSVPFFDSDIIPFM